VSYTVAQRTGEFGIRMALGAQRSHVLSIVCKSVAVSLGSGLSAGAILALLLNRILSHWAEVGVRDPHVLVLVTSLLTLVAILACAIPARRAANVDPVVALRD
jgi:putative ABC transport system permease protein